MTTKLRWTECGDKLISTNGTVQYRIRNVDNHSNIVRASASLQALGSFINQQRAIQACQAYEDQLNA